MNKKFATALTLGVAALVMTTPILFALYLAKQQGREAEAEHVLAYAKDVQRRSDETTDQLYRGAELLVAAHSSDPCSDANIALMRKIALSSSNILAIGAISGDKLLCSSLGKEENGLPIKARDLVTSTGATVRDRVILPYAPGVSFLMVERAGYAAIIHRNVHIDATTAEKGVTLASFTTDNQQVLASRGHIKQEWLKRLGTKPELTFIDDGYLVAITRSDRYTTGSLAAVPAKLFQERSVTFAIWLVPIGLLAGIVLTLTILRLTNAPFEMPAMIRSALKRNEFFLLYQPIVDLRSGSIVGAEALIRWQRPDGRLIGPDIFIPAAEDSGQIRLITKRVLALIAHDAADLFLRFPDFHIAINLSADDLQAGETVDLLRQLALHTSAGPGNLIVEATEHGLLDTDKTRAVVQSLGSNGVRVAIDDFGTGYSSLSYLESFELDFLKIDKSFVDSLGTEAATSQVALHIIEMAKTLKLDMIAEGVEMESQAAFLRERGVQFAQGWLFDKPMPFQALIGKLAQPVEEI